MSGFVEQLSQMRKYQGQLTTQQLASSLSDLQELDKTSEQKKAKGCMVAAGGIAVAFLGGIGSLAIEQGILAGICAVIGIGLAIKGFITRVNAGRTDFEDRRYQLLDRLTRLLSADIDPDSPINVQLDLGKVNGSSKIVANRKVGVWNVKFYEDPWLNLQGKLMDGTRFTVVFIEKHQDRSRTKRSASGKLKHKSKTKSAVQAVVSLKPKEKRYPNAGALGARARGAVQLPHGVQLKDLSTRENVLTLKTASKSTWNVDSGTQLLSQMLLSLYQVLNLSRQIDKAQS
jgi:hypothetical protein